LILASNQVVLSLSKGLRAIVYVFSPDCNAFIAYVVVTCTREPLNSIVRTMALFSKDSDEAREGETKAARRKNGRR